MTLYGCTAVHTHRYPINKQHWRFFLQNTSIIWPLLTTSTAATLAWAIIIPHLENCESFLTGQASVLVPLMHSQHSSQHDPILLKDSPVVSQLSNSESQISQNSPQSFMQSDFSTTFLVRASFSPLSLSKPPTFGLGRSPKWGNLPLSYPTHSFVSKPRKHHLAVQSSIYNPHCVCTHILPCLCEHEK